MSRGGKRPGAGRPPVYPSGHVSRSLSLDMRADERLTRYMREHGVTRSQAASALILSGGGRARRRRGAV